MSNTNQTRGDPVSPHMDLTFQSKGGQGGNPPNQTTLEIPPRSVKTEKMSVGELLDNIKCNKYILYEYCSSLDADPDCDCTISFTTDYTDLRKSVIERLDSFEQIYQIDYESRNSRSCGISISGYQMMISYELFGINKKIRNIIKKDIKGALAKIGHELGEDDQNEDAGENDEEDDHQQ